MGVECQQELAASEAELEKLEAELHASQSAVKVAVAEARGLLGTWHNPEEKPREASPSQLPGYLQELQQLNSGAEYVQAVLKLQQMLNRLEQSVKQLSSADSENTGGAGAESFSELAAQAVSASAGTTYHCNTLRPLLQDTSSGLPQPLVSYAADVMAHVQASLRTLRSCLSTAFSSALERAGWPPAMDGGAPAFESCGKDDLRLLYELTGFLTETQRNLDPETFSAPEEPRGGSPPPGPLLLWAAELLVEPLRKKLTYHFAGGLQTDRMDKPEWMFAQVLRMAREVAPEAAVLDGALQECNLHQQRPFSVQVVDGLRAAATDILAAHYLPNILEMSQASLWLHLVDEMCTFERQLAPLRGELDEDEELMLGPPIWVEGSCLVALVEDRQSMAAWERAELLEAQQQMDSAVEAEAGWSAVCTEWEGSTSAWKSEFWPPKPAETALAILQGLMQRASCLPGLQAAPSFGSHVLAPVAKSLLGYMNRLGQRADTFKDLSSETWAPKVCALCCGAHFLEHNLQELGATLLPEEAARSAPEKVARELATFRHKWTLKLAEAVTHKFIAAASLYRSSVADFMGEGAEDEGTLEVSRTWRPAVQQLQEALHRLSGLLDTVLFREMWRAVATAVNQILYNDIATEAQFSACGALQFVTDCNAIISIFAMYTPRPNAHFKELREACILLSLSEEQLAELEEAIDDEDEGLQDTARAIVEALGVRTLNLDQVECVLAQRL
mmetsp:Transcript_34775/g.98590  ORF Transcript_34775/g.98590 Transcript_34775/m.98590 type:complete len:731 (-) Transcript_34775:17-2209(-)